MAQDLWCSHPSAHLSPGAPTRVDIRDGKFSFRTSPVHAHALHWVVITPPLAPGAELPCQPQCGFAPHDARSTSGISFDESPGCWFRDEGPVQVSHLNELRASSAISSTQRCSRVWHRLSGWPLRGRCRGSNKPRGTLPTSLLLKQHAQHHVLDLEVNLPTAQTAAAPTDTPTNEPLG